MQAKLKAPRKPRATIAAESETIAPVAAPESETIAPETTESETIAPVAETTESDAAPETTESETTESAPVAETITYKTATRDAATILAQATNFALSSDRDTAFLLFYGLVMRANGDTATLAQLHAAGTPAGSGNRRSNPFYTGSAKATDAGAINRLVKAGYITVSESGNRLHATAKALASGAYNKA